MMKNISKYISRLLLSAMAVCLCASAVSCTEDYDEPYDHPFVYIDADGGASRIVVNSDVNNVNTYNVYLSSRALSRNLEVSYEITVGDGLQAGRDFELITTGNTLTFLPGIYDMPIRIRWKPYPVDPSKNNTLTIRLTGADADITLGLPGPDGLQRQLVIEKKNP